MTNENDVCLREINKDNVSQICALSATLSERQRNFVADNAYAIACSHYTDFSWIRAVYVGENPAGFIELHDRPDIPKYVLWRFMIARQFQGAGIGQQAIRHLASYVGGRPNAKELVTSYIEGDGNPRRFYEKLGFKLNGKFYNGEAELCLRLN